MRRLIQEMVVLAIGAVALIYLFNPTAGFLEFIPDALPLVGNIDEGLAVIVLTNVLAYYGINVNRLAAPRNKD